MASLNVRSRLRCRGFTLLEVLVALVIFGTITVALSFTFDTAFKTQEANNRRVEELGAVRSVFDYMTHDLLQAYGTDNSAASVFIAGGSQSGPQSAGSGSLLKFVTRGNHIQYSSLAGVTGASAQTGPASGATTDPQSESIMVRYDFDPSARTLSRTTVPVPSLTTLQSTNPGPEVSISNIVDDISLRFWDPTAQTWRTDWDFEQQNQQGATQGTGGTTGAAATGTTFGTTTSTTSSATGDTTLPGMVEITLTIRHPDSTTATYIATVPIMTSQVADGMAPPTKPLDTATGTGTGQ